MKECPYCENGRITIEGSYGYRCPDCNGTGYIQEEGVDFWICPRCEKVIYYELKEDELCEKCLEIEEYERLYSNGC